MQAMNQDVLRAIVTLIPNSQKHLKGNGDRKNLEVEGGPLEDAAQTEKKSKSTLFILSSHAATKHQLLLLQKS